MFRTNSNFETHFNGLYKLRRQKCWYTDGMMETDQTATYLGRSDIFFRNKLQMKMYAKGNLHSQ